MLKVSMPVDTCSTYSPMSSLPMPAAYSTTSKGRWGNCCVVVVQIVGIGICWLFVAGAGTPGAGVGCGSAERGGWGRAATAATALHAGIPLQHSTAQHPPRPRKTSPRASASVLPCSWVMLAASSSVCRLISSCMDGVVWGGAEGRAEAAEASQASGDIWGNAVCRAYISKGRGAGNEQERTQSQKNRGPPTPMVLTNPCAHAAAHLKAEHDACAVGHRCGAPLGKGVLARLHRRVELLRGAQRQAGYHLLGAGRKEGGRGGIEGAAAARNGGALPLLFWLVALSTSHAAFNASRANATFYSNNESSCNS
jgi:hypothetical protein